MANPSTISWLKVTIIQSWSVHFLLLSHLFSTNCKAARIFPSTWSEPSVQFDCSTTIQLRRSCSTCNFRPCYWIDSPEYDSITWWHHLNLFKSRRYTILERTKVRYTHFKQCLHSGPSNKNGCLSTTSLYWTKNDSSLSCITRYIRCSQRTLRMVKNKPRQSSSDALEGFVRQLPPWNPARTK